MDERRQFAAELASRHLRPLWERGRRGAGRKAVAAMWRYDELRPALLRAAALVSTGDAGRRVLQLENPGLPESGLIGPTLFAGMQILLAGETAPGHRHAANALRFIVEGSGGYTTVDGDRLAFEPGDFLVTPGWSWHDHGNSGAAPVIWMDGLDLPLTQLFGAALSEARGEQIAPAASSSRKLVYRYETACEGLQCIAGSRDPHPAHGYEWRYVDPCGRDPLPTIAAFMQRLPAGFRAAAYWSTETRIFSVAEGNGEACIADSTFRFAQGDVFVVPSGTCYRLNAETRSLLFSYSDRAAQEALGFYRESFATALS